MALLALVASLDLIKPVQRTMTTNCLMIGGLLRRFSPR
jgi:hypothetical protein